MAAQVYYSPFIPAFDSNGLPIAGAQLRFRLTGTTTATPIYTTSALTTQHTNPVVADAAGRFADIYLNDTITYRVDILDAAGTQISSIDPYIPGRALKGDPGANVMAVGLASAIGTLTIPAGTDLIQTTGYTTAGWGAALYVRDGTTALSTRGSTLKTAAVAGGVAAGTAETALLAQEVRWRKVDAGGNYWTLYKAQRIESAMFGALHDATDSGGVFPNRWSGTDDQPAIQAMVDWCIYWENGAPVHLSKGIARIGDTVHLGYGQIFSTVSYHSIQFFGNGSSLYGELPQSSALVRNFMNKPGINVAGAREAVLRGFGFEGASNYYEANWLSHDQYMPGRGLVSSFPTSLPTIDDTISRNWSDPAVTTALGKNQDHRYSPDTAICIDAYAGAAPSGNFTGTMQHDNTTGNVAAVAYANATYPAWFAPGTSQYAKNYTSGGVLIEEVSFKNETNCVVLMPSGTLDANCDYIRLRDIQADYCKRVLSSGHTQSRNLSLEYLRATFLYEWLSNNTHGYKTGRFDIGARDCSTHGLAQLASIGSSTVSGSITFENPYVESCYRLLTVEGGNAIEPEILIVAPDIDLLGQFYWRGSPPYVIGKADSATAANVPVRIKGGIIKGMRGGLNCMADVICDGVALDPYEGGTIYGAASVAAYLACFQNGTAGGFVPSRIGSTSHYNQPHDSIFFQRDMDAGTGTAWARCSQGFRNSHRPYCLPFWASNGTSNQGFAQEAIPHPKFRTELNKASFTGTSTNGTTSDYLRYIFTAPLGTFPAYTAETQGGATGDVLRDRNTGALFVVQSYDRTTGATIARKLTGTRKNNATWENTDGFSTTVGTMDAFCTRWFIPLLPAFGDFTGTAGTNIQRSDGSAIGANVEVGDYLFRDTYLDYWTAPGDTRITAFNSAAETMTLTGAGAITAVVQKRLSLVARTVANTA